MSDISIDKKLQLIQQVRSQYNRNQYDLRSREQVLYGRTSPAAMLSERELPAYLPDEEADAPKSTFRIRLLAALVLVAAVIVLDTRDTKLLGISTGQIFAAISQNTEIGEWKLTEELASMPVSSEPAGGKAER